jgi:hypothetical protein
MYEYKPPIDAYEYRRYVENVSETESRDFVMIR